MKVLRPNTVTRIMGTGLLMYPSSTRASEQLTILRLYRLNSISGTCMTFCCNPQLLHHLIHHSSKVSHGRCRCEQCHVNFSYSGLLQVLLQRRSEPISFFSASLQIPTSTSLITILIAQFNGVIPPANNTAGLATK